MVGVKALQNVRVEQSSAIFFLHYTYIIEFIAISKKQQISKTLYMHQNGTKKLLASHGLNHISKEQWYGFYIKNNDLYTKKNAASKLW